MKQYKLNQVFEDTKNFSEPKRLKCVEDSGGMDICNRCEYLNTNSCYFITCSKEDSTDGKYRHFIETDEPLTTEP